MTYKAVNSQPILHRLCWDKKDSTIRYNFVHKTDRNCQFNLAHKKLKIRKTTETNTDV